MPRRPTGSPRALQRGRIRMDGETVSPACCGSSRSYWVSYVRNVVCPLYVPPGDKFWPFLDSYSARFRAQTDSPTASVHFSSPAIPREKGARRDTLRQLASGGGGGRSFQSRQDHLEAGFAPARWGSLRYAGSSRCVAAGPGCQNLMTVLLRGSQGLALLASTTQRPRALRDTNGMTIGCLDQKFPWYGRVR